MKNLCTTLLAVIWQQCIGKSLHSSGDISILKRLVLVRLRTTTDTPSLFISYVFEIYRLLQCKSRYSLIVVIFEFLRGGTMP